MIIKFILDKIRSEQDIHWINYRPYDKCFDKIWFATSDIRKLDEEN